MFMNKKTVECQSRDSGDHNSLLEPTRPNIGSGAPVSVIVFFLTLCTCRWCELHSPRWTRVDKIQFSLWWGKGDRVEVYTRSRVCLKGARYGSPCSRRDCLVQYVNIWSVWPFHYLSCIAILHFVFCYVAAFARNSKRLSWNLITPVHSIQE